MPWQWITPQAYLSSNDSYSSWRRKHANNFMLFDNSEESPSIWSTNWLTLEINMAFLGLSTVQITRNVQFLESKFAEVNIL